MMEQDPYLLSTEGKGENPETTSNAVHERPEEAELGDEFSNVGAKVSAIESGHNSKDNSVMLNSKDISVESSESDHHVVSETHSRTPEERERISAITVSNKNETLQPLKGSKNKPGVILLGRGNSFSLGRSEVILLHSRPAKRNRKSDAKEGLDENPLDSIQEQSNTPPSPPPISEGVSSKMDPHTNGWDRSDMVEEELGRNESIGDTDADAFAKSLHQLWSKAEEVMTANEGRVLKVLEEFGIGELGGGGGDEGGEGMQEEEQVWQIVQENYRSQQ